ncbi:TetR/AcrR family transcriptional regulator [Leifsonia sp. AG29]|uniref:TetR/AcrR family transcriptional regulator n=1 Tax=Leifsonia sp. AG29 TaxID=2598860 RepID=UPI00131B5885|nr:TetR/AcrR family transcriptional regulator [Leifsonia sp. AG29]
MTTYLRARSQGQREERQRHILETAAAMLAELSVSDLTLTELARRAGRSKAHIISYFETRETVLLALLEREAARWLDAFATSLQARPESARGSSLKRADRFAQRVARSLDEDPVLCELLSAEAAVLERNVSTALAENHKRVVSDLFARLAETILSALPELGEPGARAAAGSLVVLAGALWVHAHPAPSVAAVYQKDPSLAAFGTDFASMLEEMFATQVRGLLAVSLS